MLFISHGHEISWIPLCGHQKEAWAHADRWRIWQSEHMPCISREGDRLLVCPSLGNKSKCCTCYLSQWQIIQRAGLLGEYMSTDLWTKAEPSLWPALTMTWDRVWRGKCQTNNAFRSPHHVCLLHPGAHLLMLNNIITVEKRKHYAFSHFLTEISRLKK